MRKAKALNAVLDEIRTRLERLDVALITRYPDTTRATEEYSALRKAVMSMASSEGMQRHNLITLVNAIDEGASTGTVRGKIVDLLSTLKVTEVATSERVSLSSADAARIFQVVGDEASPRSAWLLSTEEGLEVLQKGRVTTLTEDANTDHAESPAILQESASSPGPGGSVHAESSDDEGSIEGNAEVNEADASNEENQS